jgi:hypothetical protein
MSNRNDNNNNNVAVIAVIITALAPVAAFAQEGRPDEATSSLVVQQV